MHSLDYHEVTQLCLGKLKNEWKEPIKQTLYRNAGYVKRLQTMNM